MIHTFSFVIQQPLFNVQPSWIFNKPKFRAGLDNVRSRKERGWWIEFITIQISILGDPGAVSRAGLKGTKKVFKHGRKSSWVPTLTGPFPNGQENAGSWLGTKNALYYCAQSANSFSWVLFVSLYSTAIVSRHSCPVRSPSFPNKKRRNYRWVEKRFGCYQQEQFNSHWETEFCFWRITMYRK